MMIFFLIVTKTGKIESASAIGYMFGRYLNISAFLNIGIAGHCDLDIGSFVLAHKISENEKSIYPLILFDYEGVSKQIITQDTIEKEYKSDSIYDMEAYSCLKVASNFLPYELIHSIKVISDNKQFEASTVTEEAVHLFNAKKYRRN